ncbi:hypothetical protein AB188_16410 [Serratia marcescens]|nr:hypothetical protein AB188_16410 [Serratia marcescens]
MTARREAAFLLHLPATGAGKTGNFATFFFTDSAIELKAVILQKGAALFRIWRGKCGIFHVALSVFVLTGKASEIWTGLSMNRGLNKAPYPK